MKRCGFLLSAASLLLGVLLGVMGVPPSSMAESEALPTASATSAPPVVLADAQAGHWLYQSNALRVEITRKTDPSIPLIWYEADLLCSADAPLRCVLSAEQKPATHLKKPDAIAQRDGLIYAQTDDFFGDRVGSKKLKPGVVIRGGRLLYDSVYSGGGNPFPPLDTLAIFPDGTLETFLAREYTGSEYVAMGATDVISFGPILIRDGQMDTRLLHGYTNREPRSAIGMIAPYHYFAVVVEGRHDGSAGCGLPWLAKRMLEAGVAEALNLDGGQTAAMIFEGVQLNQTGKFLHKTSVRSVSGVLGLSDAP